MSADIALTHRIPHAVVTTDSKEFIKLRDTLKLGKVLLIDRSDVKPLMSQQGPVIFYTWYGEEAVTKQAYEAWDKKPLLHKV